MPEPLTQRPGQTLEQYEGARSLQRTATGVAVWA